MTLNKLEPAATVLRLMGVRPLARKLGVSPGYVGQWQMDGSRGGLGGRVPIGHRAAILARAQKLGHHQITENLLNTLPEVPMGKFSRDKGARYERKIVNKLKAAGFHALKIPLSGAAEGYPGDIEIFHDVFGRLLCQNKCGKEIGGYKKLNAVLCDVGVIKVGGVMNTYIALDWQNWMALINGDFYPPVRMPEIELQTAVIDGAIVGHEVLFFQLNRQPDRVILDQNCFYSLLELQPNIGRSERIGQSPVADAA